MDTKFRYRLRYGTKEAPQNYWLSGEPDMVSVETKAKIFKTADEADKFRMKASRQYRMARNFYIEELTSAEIFV